MTSQGVAMFCYDTEFAYSEMCNFNIGQIKTFLTRNITVYADSDTAARLDRSVDIVITPLPDPNSRYFRNINKQLTWHNANRSMIFAQPPYDKTIVIDVDYIIYSEFLKNLWQVNYDLMCYTKSCDLAGKYESHKEKVGESMIPFSWATVLLVTKSQLCRQLYFLFNHIKEHWSWYCKLYRIKTSNFRNDFALSIALHTLNGFRNHRFGIPGVMSCVTDEAAVTLGGKKFTYSFEKNGLQYKHTSTGLDVHVLNKIVTYE